jgi:hypothetical protein
MNMTYETWFSELVTIFASFETNTHPQDTGWNWQAIYEEGLTPREAYEDWSDTQI